MAQKIPSFGVSTCSDVPEAPQPCLPAPSGAGPCPEGSSLLTAAGVLPASPGPPVTPCLNSFTGSKRPEGFIRGPCALQARGSLPLCSCAAKLQGSAKSLGQDFCLNRSMEWRICFLSVQFPPPGMAVPNLGCTLDSPRVISKVLKPQTRQRPEKSQFLWREGTQASVPFKTLQ